MGGLKIKDKINSIVELKALINVPIGKVIEVDSYYGDGNGGGNTFVKVTVVAQQDNGGTIIQGSDGSIYESIDQRLADIRQFGCKPNDDTFNCSPVIQSMIDDMIDIDCYGNDDFYMDGDSTDNFVSIDETKSGIYINFGENIINIKFTDVSGFLNARGVFRFEGGTTKPNFKIGKIKFKGEFDYDAYIIALDADLAAESVPATTGIGRFGESTSAAGTALVTFQTAFRISLENLTSTVIEGVQFIGEFGVVNVDSVYGEFMNQELVRANGSAKSTINIKEIVNDKSWGFAITCNVINSISSTQIPMYLNIDNLISTNCTGAFDLTSATKTEVSTDGYAIAVIKNVYITGQSYFTKIHGAWDVNIQSFTNLFPHEYSAISYPALRQAYDYARSIKIDYMKVDGFIGTRPVNEESSNGNPVEIEYLDVLNTYYLANKNTNIRAGQSKNCKDVFVKDCINSSISNFTFKNDEGINYQTMFGGSYANDANWLAVNNLKIENCNFYNYLSYDNLPAYFMRYKGGVVNPDLDRDYLLFKNVNFYEDTNDSAHKPSGAFCRIMQQKGLLEFDNVHFFRAGTEVTDIRLVFVQTGSFRPYIKVEDIGTNLFAGGAGFQVIGNGTMEYIAKKYKWVYNNVWYENSTFPTDHEDGTIVTTSTVNQTDSVAVDVATLVTDFNALLLKLQNAGLMQ